MSNNIIPEKGVSIFSFLYILNYQLTGGNIPILIKASKIKGCRLRNFLTFDTTVLEREGLI
jgi:hypothetical protein